jgi:hypothetical protein
MTLMERINVRLADWFEAYGFACLNLDLLAAMIGGAINDSVPSRDSRTMRVMARFDAAGLDELLEPFPPESNRANIVGAASRRGVLQRPPKLSLLAGRYYLPLATIEVVHSGLRIKFGACIILVIGWNWPK